MNPHDRFYRDCQGLRSYRKLRRAAEWLLIGLACLAFVGMLGYCQTADEHAAIVAQGGQ